MDPDVERSLRTVTIDPRGRRIKVVAKDGTISETTADKVLATLLEQQGIASIIRPEVEAAKGIRPCRKCARLFERWRENPKARWLVWCARCYVEASRCSSCGAEASKKMLRKRLTEEAGSACARCLDRSGIARKGNAKLTPEERSERARRAHAKLTPEERSERARKAHAKSTPEERSERARKAVAAWGAKFTPEERSEIARKAHAKLTSEERSERSRKANKTKALRPKP